MRTLPLAAAKATLSAVIDEVEQGHEVVITRRGRPVARIVPETIASRRRSRRAWTESLRAFVEAQVRSDESSVLQMRAAERY